MRFSAAESRGRRSAAIFVLILLLLAMWCLYSRPEPISVEQLVAWENLGYVLSFALGLMHLVIFLIGLIGATDTHAGSAHAKTFGKEGFAKSPPKDFAKALEKEGFDKALAKEGFEKEGFAKTLDRIFERALGRLSPDEGDAVETSRASGAAKRDVSRPSASIASLAGLGHVPLSFYLPAYFFLFSFLGISLNAFSVSILAINFLYGAANYLLAMLGAFVGMGLFARRLVKRLRVSPTMAILDRLAAAKWDFVKNRGFIHIRVGGAILEFKAMNIDPAREIRRGDAVELVRYDPDVSTFCVAKPRRISQEHRDRR